MAPKKDAKKDGKKEELSPEDKLQAELVLVESEKSDLNIELSFLKDKIKLAHSDKSVFKADANELRERLKKAKQDYADILEHREEQIKASELRVHKLQENVDKLGSKLEERATRIKELEAENARQKRKLEECENLVGEKEQLEDVVRQQHKVVDKQNEDLQEFKQKLDEKEATLKQATLSIDDLSLKVEDKAELKILFDDMCLVEMEHRKLYGEVPIDRDGGTLTCIVGKHAVLLGGSGSPDCIPREIHTLDLESMHWSRPSATKFAYNISQHASASVSRTKILTFGGMKNGTPCAELSFLNTDTMKWQELNIKPRVQPAPRTGHTCCTIRERMFVFGGECEGALTNEMWVLDQDSQQWSKVMSFGAEPSPRAGASICASEDGRRLYIFGGNDGCKLLNDVYMLEIERLAWSAINVNSPSPEPREGHCAAIISHFMLIAGGRGLTEGSALKCLGDVHVIDLSTPTWEVLDDGQWVSSRPWMKAGGIYHAFYGTMVVTVKPDREEKLNELQVMRLVLPADIERMKSQKKRENKFQEKLELVDDVACTANSIEVGWRPPTKNVDRIDRYKLMMATTTGMVKEICQGKHLRYKVVGLKANSEYIFCVKAIYDDGSFLWSESRSFHTRIVHAK